MIRIADADLEDIPLIRSLAERIWPVAYQSILPEGQLAYMLEKIYSDAALKAQMEEQHHFLLVWEDGAPVGFADYAAIPEPGVYRLHKIYISPDLQGKGIGRILLNEVIARVSALGATILELNVNRHNKARFFYEKLGFSVHDKVDIPIGNGYFMNDYVMRKKLAPQERFNQTGGIEC